MDIKYPLDKLFEEKSAEFVDTGEEPPERVAPPALKAIALCFSQLVGHTYCIGNLSVFPVRPPELDDDAVYGLTFCLEDAPDAEYQQLARFLAAMADIPHVRVLEEGPAIEADSLSDMVLAYAALAQKHELSLAPPYTLGTLNGVDPASAALKNHYLKAIQTNPYNLLFLQDCDTYFDANHLASHVHRAFDAREAGHFIPVYSYVELTRMAADYDLHRDLNCVHTPRWQN